VIRDNLQRYVDAAKMLNYANTMASVQQEGPAHQTDTSRGEHHTKDEW
jgi:hypothetical protein